MDPLRGEASADRGVAEVAEKDEPKEGGEEVRRGRRAEG